MAADHRRPWLYRGPIVGLTAAQPTVNTLDFRYKNPNPTFPLRESRSNWRIRFLVTEGGERAAEAQTARNRPLAPQHQSHPSWPCCHATFLRINEDAFTGRTGQIALLFLDCRTLVRTLVFERSTLHYGIASCAFWAVDRHFRNHQMSFCGSAICLLLCN